MKRNALYTTQDGRSHTLQEWAKIAGISYSAFHFRARKYGLDEAISGAGKNRNNRFITFGGETKSLSVWAKHFGVSDKTFGRRVNKDGERPTLEYYSQRHRSAASHGLIDYYLSKHPAQEWEADRWITEASPTA